LITTVTTVSMVTSVPKLALVTLITMVSMCNKFTTYFQVPVATLITNLTIVPRLLWLCSVGRTVSLYRHILFSY
jgi:hypothetical protein